MKAVIVSKAGDSSVLKVTQIAKPQVKSGWSLVKVMGFGINRSEIFYQTRFVAECHLSKDSWDRMCWRH